MIPTAEELIPLSAYKFKNNGMTVKNTTISAMHP